MLFTNKGLVRKDTKQGNGQVIHCWASGYMEQPRRMRHCTTAPAGIHGAQGRRCHWTKTLPRHHTCANTHPSSFLPPIKDFSAAHVSWAVSEQVAQGPDPWGFFQLGHFILHPHLWGLGTVCKCPKLSPLHHLWEPPGKEAIIQCWTWCVGLERRMNEWMNEWWKIQVLFSDMGLGF